ncbi:MAG: hypothetical protein ACLFUH_02215, partial [Bacteroidales bacterium]
AKKNLEIVKREGVEGLDYDTRFFYENLTDSNNVPQTDFQNHIKNILEAKVKSLTELVENIEKDLKIRKTVENFYDSKVYKLLKSFYGEDNITKMSPVEIGIQDNQFIEVIKGVDTTDLIVTAPYGILSNMLKDGDKVSVVGKDELYNE